MTQPHLPDAPVDVITLIEVLEHIPLSGASSFIEGISKQLEDGGLLILTVPSTNITLNTKHYQHFTMPILQQVLVPYFKVEESGYFTDKRLAN